VLKANKLLAIVRLEKISHFVCLGVLVFDKGTTVFACVTERNILVLDIGAHHLKRIVLIN
jgi:hypothetical protein